MNEREQGEMEEQPKKSRGALRVLSIVLLIVLLTGAGLAWYGYQMLQPVAASEQEMRVVIPKGSGSAAIAQLLESKGLIRSNWAFLVYLKAKKEGSRFQAGEYNLRPGMTFAQIVDKLNEGDVVLKETIHFTVPEGYTLTQIIDKVAQDTGLNKDALWQAAVQKPEELTGLTLVRQEKNRPGLKYLLEGYLFPETYEMLKGSTEKQVIERMGLELENKLDKLPSGWKDRLAKNGLDMHDTLTIASLIEREVAVDEERPIVSSVIYNRLKEKMPLQIDATIQYLFDKPKERLFEKDLQIESPYNTYLHAGLPPGPIASPSLASIQAALFPADTKYLFYVTKKDGSRKHLFAETFEQHKRNVAASKS